MIAKTAFPVERFVGVDKFNNAYGISRNTFYKYNKDKAYQFIDLQLGTLISADIINPLRISLFYHEANTVVILDNRLNEITRINFNTISKFRTVNFASTAGNQSLWIFNVDLQELEIFDYSRTTVVTHTQSLSGTVLQQESSFNFCWLLYEKNLKIYKA